ncbi:MAG: hypothetical protein QOI12_812 [Alphaproteobacteria bacterium]|jgi:hypothetical protein|nr:hypothetical protein [Alphaproteobacteria bacterium]
MIRASTRRLHAPEQVEADVLVTVVVVAVGFERQHVLFDEGARAQADVVQLWCESEVHRPGLSSEERYLDRSIRKVASKKSTTRIIPDNKAVPKSAAGFPGACCFPEIDTSVSTRVTRPSSPNH